MFHSGYFLRTQLQDLKTISEYADKEKGNENENFSYQTSLNTYGEHDSFEYNDNRIEDAFNEFPSFLEDKYWIILKLLLGKLITFSPN